MLAFHKGLSVRISPKQLTQYWGQYVVFRCYVTGNPLPIVSWFSGDKNITHDQRLTTGKINGGYMMRLGPVHPILDNGTIECRGKNGVDPPVADKADLHALREYFSKFCFLSILLLYVTSLYCYRYCIFLILSSPLCESSTPDRSLTKQLL